MILPPVLAPTPKPVLVAVVDPVRGTAWDPKGKPVRLRLTPDDLNQTKGITSAGETVGLTGRLFLFKMPSRFEAEGGVMAKAPAMPYNHGHLPSIGMGGGWAPYRVFSGWVRPTQRTLALDLTYAAGPPKTTVAFVVRNGKVVPMVGGDRHPRVVEIPKGYEFTPERQLRRTDPGYAVGGPQLAVTFDDRPVTPGSTVGGRLFDRKGHLVEMLGTGGLYRRYETIFYRVPAQGVGRFDYRVWPNAVLHVDAALRPAR